MKHHRRLHFITILVMSSHLSCATSAAHSKNRAPSSLSAWVKPASEQGALERLEGSDTADAA